MPIRSNRKKREYFDFFSRSTGPITGTPSDPPAATYDYFGARGFHAGGNNVPSSTSIIGYYAIATTSSASSFGNLTYGRIGTDATSNETRAVFGPGSNDNSPYYGGPSTEYDYITCATTGNATTFGETSSGKGRGYVAGVSGTNGRGCYGGGNEGPASPTTKINTIDYVTIETTGNAQEFGDMTDSASARAGMSNGTRGVWAGGYESGALDMMDYITIASTGNATDFGDMEQGGHWGRGGAGNTTRGLLAGGYYTDEIEYITIATTGNGQDFGDLSPDGNGVGGCNNATRAVFMGGEGRGEAMSYVTIASTGSSSDFGETVNPGNNNYMCGASGGAS